MAFVQDDIYTSSGSTVLFNSWAPSVAKFDTSTFYNWEQDNLPLYDLEERTYELWEQQGFPTSSVPGFALTVSGDTPTLTLQQNTNIFTNLSSCVAAIPKIISFPVLVEVCNFGDLGELELHNFKIVEGGSLEIINRGFSKVYNASATIADTASIHGSTFVDKYTSADVSATLFSGIDKDSCISGVNIATQVCSSTTDVRLSSVNTVLYPMHTLRKGSLAVGIGDTSANFLPGPKDVFGLTPYDTTSTDATILTLDVSAEDPWTGGATGGGRLLRGPQANGDNMGGCVYTNSLSKISIQNCDGPIYVRNFFVDGDAGATGTGTDRGIDVHNSNVVLENCSVVRCNEAGFSLKNSKVILSRAAFAYRIYKRTNATTRLNNTTIGVGFDLYGSDVTVSAVQGGSTGTGGVDYQGSGVDVAICASRCMRGMRLHNSTLVGGYGRINPFAEGTGGIFAFELNQTHGLTLTDSSLPRVENLLDIYGNRRGMSISNSDLGFKELCVEDQKQEGLVAQNSTISYLSNVGSGTLTTVSATAFTETGQQVRKQIDFSNNSQHIVLENQSKLDIQLRENSPYYFGQTSLSTVHSAVTIGDNSGIMPAVDVRDSSHAEFINTKFLPRDAAHAPANMPAYGTGARATKNSDVTFYGTGSGCTFLMGPAGFTKQQYAAGLYAEDNSEINLHGPTFIGQFGVDALAENASIINICPPKGRSEFAYEINYFNLADTLNHTSVELHSTRACLVANKNSVINLTDIGDYNHYWPSGTEGAAILAAGDQDYPSEDTYGLSAYTGFGSLQFYPNPANSTIVGAAGSADLTGTSPGWGYSIPSYPKFGATLQMNQLINTSPFLDVTPGAWTKGGATGGTSSISLGGMCVRAVEDSQVNVLNVHFPVGPVSGVMEHPYFNANGECERLLIWNIADNSKLNAAYCSVSGTFPGDCTYHGPSALWVSSAEGHLDLTNYVPASGAPSGTPDTGSLSVLDAFGAGSSVWIVPSGIGVNDPFGRYYPVMASDAGDVASSLVGAGLAFSGLVTTNPKLYGAGPHASNNQGIFRIYFSPKSETKLLAADLSGYNYGASAGTFSGQLGVPYQIYAQGYNMSAPVSAIEGVAGSLGVSAYYPNLLKLSSDSNLDGFPTELHTSGFYYCKEFMDDNPSQCMLDESASETFANAKNASLGSSGRPKRVTLYRSRGSAQSGSEANEGDAIIGIKSANIFDLKRDN
jgi:hypothetical protein